MDTPVDQHLGHNGDIPSLRAKTQLRVGLGGLIFHNFCECIGILFIDNKIIIDTTMFGNFATNKMRVILTLNENKVKPVN